MSTSEIDLLRLLCWLTKLLPSLGFGLVTLALAWSSIQSIRRLFQGPHARFVDGVHSADLALQMTGSTGDIAPIVEEAGHLPLLRNLALDGRVFIPLYSISYAVAITLLIGMPFACGTFAFRPWAALALLLTALGAVFDWRENACLVKALRFNAQGGENAGAKRQKHLGRGRMHAVIKFVLLGGATGLLAFHASIPDATTNLPDWARHALAATLGTAALGMLVCPVRPRYLEPALTLAGCGIALLFTLHAWRLLP